ncbi:MAG: riboflavin synthase [Actinomycetota bacterium]
MFTGIVTHLGVIRAVKQRSGLMELEIDAPATAKELKRGDSVAVNGICLTAVEVHRRRFLVQVVEETQARTTIDEAARGQRVNIELPARLADRLGGHLVQGHVDGIATVLRVEDDDGSRRSWWRAEEDALRYIVRKGSVALDGVSLTVADVGRTSFEVALIPHTLDATTLGAADVGFRANLELDVIAKYVERLTTGFEQGAG